MKSEAEQEKIQIYGAMHSHSGPAIHVKKLARALTKQGFDVSVNTHYPINERYQLENDLYNLYSKPEYDKAITILIDSPETWWMHMAEPRKALIGVIVLEGNHIPIDWTMACAQPEIKQIWCPSEHVKNAMLNSARKFELDIPESKIKVVPHCYDPEIFHKSGKKKRFADSEKFTFLFVGGWSQGFKDRKGLDIFYSAFTKEFNDKEKVRAIAKVTAIYNSPGYNPTTILNTLKIPKKHALFMLATGDVQTSEELAEIYRAGDVYVLPSKAEGFSMTTLEAMACGVVPLVTNYGGQTDFVNENNGYLIDAYKVIDATDNNVSLYDWASWKLPDEKDLREKMRHIYENRKELDEKRKKILGSITKFTIEAVGALAKKYINDLK